MPSRSMKRLLVWGHGAGALPTNVPPELMAVLASGAAYNRRAAPRSYVLANGAPVAVGRVSATAREQDLLVNSFGRLAQVHRPLGRNVLYGVPPGTTDPRKTTPDAYDSGALGSRGRLSAVGTFRISSSQATWKYLRRVEAGDSARLVEWQGSSYGGGTGFGLPTNNKVPPSGELPSSSGDNEILLYPKDGSGSTAQVYSQFKYTAENPGLTQSSARAVWEYSLGGHDTRDTWIVEADTFGPYASEIRMPGGALLDSEVDLTGATPIRHRLYCTATATSITAAVRAEHHVLARKVTWPAWNQDSPHQTLNGVPDNSGDIPYGTIIAIRWQDAGLRETIGLTAFGKQLFDTFLYYGCVIGDRQGQVVNDQAVLQLRADDTLGSNGTRRDTVTTELQKLLPYLWPVFNPRSHTAGDASERHADGLYYLCGGGPLGPGSVNSAWDAK